MGRVVARMNLKNVLPLRERVWKIYKDARDKLVLDNIEAIELPPEEQRQWIAVFRAFESAKHFFFMECDREVLVVRQHRRTVVHVQRYVMHARYLGILKVVATCFPEVAAVLSTTFKNPKRLDLRHQESMASITRRFKDMKISKKYKDNIVSRLIRDRLYLACRSAGFESEQDIMEVLRPNIAEMLVEDEDELRHTLYMDFCLLPMIFGPKEASLCHVWTHMLRSLMLIFFEPREEEEEEEEERQDFLTWTLTDIFKRSRETIKKFPSPEVGECSRVIYSFFDV